METDSKNVTVESQDDDNVVEIVSDDGSALQFRPPRQTETVYGSQADTEMHGVGPFATRWRDSVINFMA